MPLATVKPPTPVYRSARTPDPWAARDWASVRDDDWGNDYDDPERYYRVLYGCTDRFACFVATLERFRPNLALLAELQAIRGENDFVPVGTVAAGWLAKRSMGSAQVGGEFVNILDSDSIDFLRLQLAAESVQLALGELDAEALRRHTAPRRFTQLVSRTIYNLGFRGAACALALRGALTRTHVAWAIFEPFEIAPEPAEKIRPDDPDLCRALELHGLRLESRRTG